MPHQAGAGLGSIFTGLLRAVAPVAKDIGKHLGKRAIATGARIADDALSGKNVKESIGRRLKDTGGDLLNDVSRAVTLGVNKRRAAPKKRKRTSSSTAASSLAKRRRRKRDIF